MEVSFLYINIGMFTWNWEERNLLNKEVQVEEGVGLVFCWVVIGLFTDPLWLLTEQGVIMSWRRVRQACKVVS